jgi:hypothetical protein
VLNAVGIVPEIHITVYVFDFDSDGNGGLGTARQYHVSYGLYKNTTALFFISNLTHETMHILQATQAQVLSDPLKEGQAQHVQLLSYLHLIDSTSDCQSIIGLTKSAVKSSLTADIYYPHALFASTENFYNTLISRPVTDGTINWGTNSSNYLISNSFISYIADQYNYTMLNQWLGDVTHN